MNEERQKEMEALVTPALEGGIDEFGAMRGCDCSACRRARDRARGQSAYISLRGDATAPAPEPPPSFRPTDWDIKFGLYGESTGTGCCAVVPLLHFGNMPGKDYIGGYASPYKKLSVKDRKIRTEIVKQSREWFSEQLKATGTPSTAYSSWQGETGVIHMITLNETQVQKRPDLLDLLFENDFKLRDMVKNKNTGRVVYLFLRVPENAKITLTKKNRRYGRLKKLLPDG